MSSASPSLACLRKGILSIVILSLVSSMFLISYQSALIRRSATRDLPGASGYQGAATKIDFTQGRFGKQITGTDHLIVYNRVPKCGSRTLLALFNQLKQEGHFDTIISTQGFRIPPNLGFTEGQEALKRIINQEIETIKRLPSTVEGHFRFHDVDRSKKPIYINLIRDPLDRMVSQYYYRRFGDPQTSEEFLKKELRKVIAPEYINQTFNECVLTGREECSITSFQTSFFCGIHPKCSVPSEWTLAQAKKHVVEDYTVVGTVDDYNGFLVVLEILMPSIFDGLSTKYINQIKSPSQNKTESTKSFKLAPPTPEVEMIMRQRMDMEFKFYYFVKERFKQLKIHLGLASF